MRIHDALKSKPNTIALRSSTATEVTGVLRTKVATAMRCGCVVDPNLGV